MRLIFAAITVVSFSFQWSGIADAQEQVTPKQNVATTFSHSKVGVLEAYPDRIMARLEHRDRILASAQPRTSPIAPSFIINQSKISGHWNPGKTLKVAFKGGDPLLHKQIADAANEWTRYANLTFDFGFNPTAGTYRTWSASDTAFAADIRVSFDQSGYYSLVGNDSINLAVTNPGEESLNLEYFASALPTDWRSVVLHEFGHAIAFEHEHQQPVNNPCDFRFDDDPGYTPTTDAHGQFIQDRRGLRPGLYTVLGGPPNNWPKAKVDFNLRKLPDSHAYLTGPFDKNSIMKYYFPEWMFISGAQSPCCTPAENLALSAEDQQGAAKVYPRTPAEVRHAINLRVESLNSLLQLQYISPQQMEHYRAQLNQTK
jgi:hypothetical protein